MHYRAFNHSFCARLAATLSGLKTVYLYGGAVLVYVSVVKWNYMKITYSALSTVFLFIFIFFTNNANAATPSVTDSPFLTQVSIEAQVRTYFKDAPAMIEIARCESKFRQFTDSGNVLRGPGGMVGIFQFYESIHAPAALALGFDLTTVAGNLGYARHVYNTEGLRPWNSSRYCWDIPGAFNVAPTVTSAPTKTTAVIVPVATTLSAAKRAELQEKIVMLTKLIALLQKQLAAKQGRPLS